MDLMLTNEEVVCEIVNERYENISDHDTIVMKVDLEVPKEETSSKKNYYTIKIPLYRTDKMSWDQINKSKEFLESQKWENVDVGS